MTSLHRDNRIVRPMLLVEADLMHINVYSFLHNIGPISFLLVYSSLSLSRIIGLL